MNTFSLCTSFSNFIMKTQLYGSSWCISALYFATFIASCKPANTTTLENVSNVYKKIKVCILIIRHSKFCVEIWRNLYFTAVKIFVLPVKELNVVARSEIRLDVAVRLIVPTLILSGPILISALYITRGL